MFNRSKIELLLGQLQIYLGAKGKDKHHIVYCRNNTPKQNEFNQKVDWGQKKNFIVKTKIATFLKFRWSRELFAYRTTDRCKIYRQTQEPCSNFKNEKNGVFNSNMYKYIYSKSCNKSVPDWSEKQSNSYTNIRSEENTSLFLLQHHVTIIFPLLDSWAKNEKQYFHSSNGFWRCPKLFSMVTDRAEEEYIAINFHVFGRAINIFSFHSSSFQWKYKYQYIAICKLTPP